MGDFKRACSRRFQELLERRFCWRDLSHLKFREFYSENLRQHDFILKWDGPTGKSQKTQEEEPAAAGAA